jgi:hypothetical protein
MSIKCFLGFHDWVYGEIDSILEGRPDIHPKFKTRMCLKCQKYQYITQRPISFGNEWYDLTPGTKVIKLKTI